MPCPVKGESSRGVKAFPPLGEWAEKAPNIAPTNSVIQWRRPLDRICERPILDKYIEAYGEEKICVLPMEAISNHPSFFAERLGRFLGINHKELLQILDHPPEGQRVKDGKLNLRKSQISRGPWRILKRFGVRPREKMVNADITIPKPIRNAIKRECGDSNREIAARFNLPLKELGYPWPD